MIPYFFFAIQGIFLFTDSNIGNLELSLLGDIKIKDLPSVWLYVYLIVAIAGGGYLTWAVYSYLKSNNKKKKELSSILFIIVIALTVGILITVSYEYVPERYSSYHKDSNGMSVTIDYPSPLSIPVKNLKTDIMKHINVTVYNYDKGVEIDTVKLLSPDNSTLTLKKSQFSDDSSNKAKNKLQFFTKISAQHSGEIFNKKENYTLDVTYLDHRTRVPICNVALPIQNITANNFQTNSVGESQTELKPELAADNNDNTRWANKGPSRITFDLGSQKNICSVKILWYKANVMQYNPIIYVSNDNSTFSVITGKYNGTDIVIDESSNANGRYLKIESNGNSNGYVTINETQIFTSNLTSSQYLKDVSDSLYDETDVYHNQITFPWVIKSLDMNLITYFWIVMTGVVTSRFLDFLLVRLKKEDEITKLLEEQMSKHIKNEGSIDNEITNRRIQDLRDKFGYFRDNIVQDLHWKELLWIVFSFIVAILVFAGFKQNVTPINSILINISLAFAFGFTFDRTLEMATRFKPIFTSDST
jgi:hypothetical protein